MADEAPPSMEPVSGPAETELESGAVVKAHLLSPTDLPSTISSLMAGKERSESSSGMIDPPFVAETLIRIWEHSSALRQNIDAYVTNIDSFGHRFEPSVDLAAPDADTKIRDALYFEHLTIAEERGQSATTVAEPPSDEITQRKDVLIRRARIELNRLRSFFNFCCPDLSFVELRRLTRQDLEITGNGYWEVIRNRVGEVSRLVHVPAVSMRLTPRDANPVDVEEWVPSSELAWQQVRQKRFFRRFVQLERQEKPVYFKEFGDPRMISRLSGEVVDETSTRPKDDFDATEILHFQIPHPNSSYGVPRWIGNLPTVLGLRELDIVNFSYFENKTVPPLAVLVSGGKLARGVTGKIEEFFQERIKGKQNYHKILILEAEGQKAAAGAAPTIVPKVQFVPLREAQQTDALFQEYEEKGIEKIGSSFRLPRILVGRDRAINRACYSADTEVLTEVGWKLHDTVTEDERIAVYDPRTEGMHYELPTGLAAYPYTGTMVHWRNKQIDLLVTPDHAVCVALPQAVRAARKEGRTPSWQVVKAQEVSYARFCVPATVAQYIGEPAPATFEIPRLAGCKLDHAHEPIPFVDWLNFVGSYIADGGILQSAAGRARSLYWVMLRAQKPVGRAHIEALAARLPWNATRTEKLDGTLVLTYTHKCLWHYVQEHLGGYCEERKLPSELARLERPALKTLLAAAMIGDGWRPGQGRDYAVYYSNSTRLAGQIQQIALQLGLRAAIRPGERCNRVVQSEARTTELGPGDVTKEAYSGWVYCFSTSTGFYVTRRNGKIALQGNTAFASLRMSEDQVFSPEREKFDTVMNRWLLPALGVTFWRFRSNAPTTRDPEVLAEMIAKLAKVGVITPQEGRELAAGVFNRDFACITDDWAAKPLALTLAAQRDPEYALTATGANESAPPSNAGESLVSSDGANNKPPAENFSPVGAPLRALGEEQEPNA